MESAKASTCCSMPGLNQWQYSWGAGGGSDTPVCVKRPGWNQSIPLRGRSRPTGWTRRGQMTCCYLFGHCQMHMRHPARDLLVVQCQRQAGRQAGRAPRSCELWGQASKQATPVAAQAHSCYHGAAAAPAAGVGRDGSCAVPLSRARPGAVSAQPTAGHSHEGAHKW
jgi:hypothetical protein